MSNIIENNGEGSVRKLPSGKWECIIQTNHINPETLKKKRIKRTADTKEEARKKAKTALKAWKREYLDSKANSKIDKKKTFGSYMQDYLTEKVSKRIADSTYCSYDRCMKRYFFKYSIANEQLHNLSKVVFQNYYDELAVKFKRGTYILCVQMCRRLCNELRERGLLEENFAEYAVINKKCVDAYNREKATEILNRKNVYSEEDMYKFYQEWKTKAHGSEYDVVAVFMLEVGLRPSEFAALKIEDVDYENRTLRTDHTRGFRYKDKEHPELGTEEYIKTIKNNKLAYLPLTDVALECCKDMQERTKSRCIKNSDGWLYPTFRTGKPRSPSSMETSFKLLCDMLEIDRRPTRQADGRLKGLCLYDLRHSMITWANSAKNGNATITAMVARHSVKVDTEVYTHANINAMRMVETPISSIVKKIENDKNTDVNSDIELTEDEEIRLLKHLMKKYKDKI